MAISLDSEAGQDVSEAISQAGADAQTVSSAPTDPSSHPTGSNEDAGEQVADDGTDAPRLFGGLTAQEAGRRSAQARREREQSHEADAAHARKDEVIVVRTTVETGKVIDSLSKAAKQGNVQASRELRGWLSELPVEADTDVSALDRRTRQALLARLLHEVQEEGDAHSLEDSTEAAESDDATPLNGGTPVAGTA